MRSVLFFFGLFAALAVVADATDKGKVTASVYNASPRAVFPLLEKWLGEPINVDAEVRALRGGVSFECRDVPRSEAVEIVTRALARAGVELVRDEKEGRRARLIRRPNES
jgi:hypothetical protein